MSSGSPATSGDASREAVSRWRVGAVVSIAGCAVVGWYVQDVAGIRLYTTLPPLTADLDPRVSLRLVVAVAAGGAVAWWGPAVAGRLPGSLDRSSEQCVDGVVILTQYPELRVFPSRK